MALGKYITDIVYTDFVLLLKKVPKEKKGVQVSREMCHCWCVN